MRKGWIKKSKSVNSVVVQTVKPSGQVSAVSICINWPRGMRELSG